VCNYSDQLFELKAEYCLARAEPAEYIPRSGEESPDKLSVDTSVNMLSVSAGSSGRTDLSPFAGGDPVATSSAMTAGASTTAAGADTPVADAIAMMEMPPQMDKPVAEDPYSHVQCLIDDLTDEQRAHATAFIQSRSNVFSRSEYDIGRTRIIPHRIDTEDNMPHFEQLRRHPTTQLPMIDEHVKHMLAHDVIEPAASPWSSNVVMVREYAGTYRSTRPLA